MSNDMIPSGRPSKEETRDKSENWVNGYTATGAGLVVATALVPGAGTAILISIESIMCYQIGKFYDRDITKSGAAAIAGVIGIASLVGPIAAFEASLLLGPFAFAAKPAIAAGIIKAMGQLVIKHFEDTYFENNSGG